MFEKFKSYINKDHVDLSTGNVDPFEFHQTFYKMLVAYKVADLRSEDPPSYFNQNAILFLTALTATIITLTSFCHGLETLDIPYMTEAGAYTIVLGYKLLILSCTRRNIPQYHNLLRALKEDFQYICTVGEKYRALYFENQLKTWKICIFTCMFNASVPIGMNIIAFIALFYFLATNDADSGESRPLLFPYWMPNVDFGKSPIYEIAFMFANVTILLYSYNYTFMLQTQIVWIRQITSKVDIITWSLQDLLVDVHPATNKEESEYFSNLIETRMRDIVIHHQSMYSLMENYAIVYKKLLLFEQTISGPVVCLSAYCIAEKLDQGEFQGILLLLCVTAIVLYFIPSFMCTYLTIKVKSVCDACWNIPFWNAGPVIRPYMVLIMQRSLRPLPLQAPGFKDISLETFSNKRTVAMFEKFKSYINKDHVDLSTGNVDPFEFHQTFYKMLVAYKVADLRSEDPPSYFNQNAILFLTALTATIITLTSFCHGLETLDIPYMTEAGAYTIVLGYKLLILSCTRRNIPQYHNLLRALKEDFQYICTVGEKYRALYFENQLKTWKICIFTCMFNASVPIGMNIIAFIALFYFLATNDADSGESRPLLFPYWMPNVDFGKSPIYEIAFMFANVTILLYSYNYTFMLQTQIVWIRQITSKVDIITWSLQDLLVDVHPATNKEESEYFSNLIETRMRDIVIHHQSMYSLMENYAIVYKKLLLFEQTISGPVVCLSAYCIAEKLDQGEFQGILLLLCVTAIVLYFIPSFMCTYLTIKVKSVCDACWNIPFWNAGPVIRPYMVLIMQRSLRPLPLQAPGFKDISLETFSNTMTSSYSLFNMLRQTNL